MLLPVYTTASVRKVRPVDVRKYVSMLQAACTAKELKELVTMPSVAVHAQPEQLAVSDADKAEMKAVRLKRRIFELISNVSHQQLCL